MEEIMNLLLYYNETSKFINLTLFIKNKSEHVAGQAFRTKSLYIIINQKK